MRKEETSRMSILLVEKGAAFSERVGNWLDDGGYETRCVADFGQALEVLSDFTDRVRPEIVLLEVTSLSENFENLHDAFQFSSGTDKVTVLALSDNAAPPHRSHFFARNLDQLIGVIKNSRSTCSYLS